MSTPQNRLTPAPVRQDAICMCAHGRACSSFAPGHAVHLIQARLVSATPGEWVDATVTTADTAEGTLLLHTLDGRALAGKAELIACRWGGERVRGRFLVTWQAPVAFRRGRAASRAAT